VRKASTRYKLRQLGDFARDPSRLILAEQFGGRASAEKAPKAA
jgi:hypothetical protein